MILILSTFTLILQCLLWSVLAAFGVWVYRRVALSSLPWLGVYLLLTLPPLSLGNAWVLQQTVTVKTLPFGWSNAMSKGEFVAQLMLWNNLIGTIIKIAIAIMLLSDMVFLLSQAGVQPDKKAVRMLLLAREFSTPLGLIVVGLTALVQLGILALRFL